MGDEAAVLRRLTLQFQIPLADVLSDGIRHAGANPFLNQSLLIDAEDHAGLPGQLEDTSVQGAIFADHLGHIEPEPEALFAMFGCGRAGGRQG